MTALGSDTQAASPTSSSTASSTGSSTALRVGVLGTGVMGADHVRTFARSVSGARVVAVNDLNPARAEQVAGAYPGMRTIDDPIALVRDTEVDAVLIASADDTHEELVLACLESGKPVLCEKPLTPSPDGSLRIVAAEVELGRRLVSVGFMRRYDPGYTAMRATLTGGELGAALVLHCIHRNASSRPHNPSASLIVASGIHEIDIARWLLDEEIVRGTVHLPRRSGLVVGETRDPMILVLETECGVVVDVEVYLNCRYGYDVRCELLAESGAVTLDHLAPVVRRSERMVGVEVAHDWRDRFAEAYRLELQDWVDGVARGEQRGASAWDGYAATAVASACVEALEAGVPTSTSLAPRPSLYA